MATPPTSHSQACPLTLQHGVKYGHSPNKQGVKYSHSPCQPRVKHAHSPCWSASMSIPPGLDSRSTTSLPSLESRTAIPSPALQHRPQGPHKTLSSSSTSSSGGAPEGSTPGKSLQAGQPYGETSDSSSSHSQACSSPRQPASEDEHWVVRRVFRFFLKCVCCRSCMNKKCIKRTKVKPI